MFRRKISDKEVDVKTLNDVMSLLKKILKVSYFFIIIAVVVGVTMILKEWEVKNFLLTILKVLSPLFIGLLIAWLFNPFVTWMQKKGIRRSIGTTITYALIIGVISILLNALIPLLIAQVNDFAHSIPSVVDSVSGWLEDLLYQFDNIEYIDVNMVQNNVSASLKSFGNGLTESLPTMTISFVKTLFSGIGAIVIGLIIGFYLLLTFDGVGDTLIGFLPKRLQTSTHELAELVNSSMIRYVQGACLDSTIIFIVSSIGLGLIGLKAPLLFGLFCGVTNVIPYAGPYIGGFPAVIVGFSQGTTTGILTLLLIVVIQFIEGNFFQPYIMSKTTKLHPVTIITGLLVFGHFWGIIGMVVSTPIIGSIKAIILFYDRKYEIFGFKDEEKKTEKTITVND